MHVPNELTPLPFRNVRSNRLALQMLLECSGSRALRFRWSGDVKEDGVQGRTRPFLQMLARLRALRGLDGSQEPASRDTSPALILIAVVLALLLAILEVDRNRSTLQSLGLMGDAFSADPIFKSP